MKIKVYTVGNDNGIWLITSLKEEVEDALMLFSDGKVKKEDEMDIWEYASWNCCNIGHNEFDKLINQIPEDKRLEFRENFNTNRCALLY